MAANRITEVATEVVTSEGSNGAITLLAVEVVTPNTNAPDPPYPSTFSLQKLILSFRESNVPVRGRNKWRFLTWTSRPQDADDEKAN